MTNDIIIDLIYSLPSSRAISQDRAYWVKTINGLIPIAVDWVSSSYDFDFTLEEYSTVVTGASQSEYTLTGKNHDLRDIISIRYGSTGTVLAKYRTADIDEIVGDSEAPDGVFGWYQFRRTIDGFPIIVLVNTPTVGGETLKVRYRKKNVLIEQFPEGFGVVIAYQVLKLINPAYSQQAEISLKQMIKRYRAGGKDVQIGSMQPHMAQTNNDIADIYGAG